MSDLFIVVLSPVARERAFKNYRSLAVLSNSFPITLEEVHAHSEVSRARQDVASKAYRKMRAGAYPKRPTHVLWLDADMVLPSPEIFRQHLGAVIETGLSISGRYVMRQAPKMAANLDEDREPIEVGEWKLRPVLAGMGCLLMPVGAFLDQIESSPRGIDLVTGEERWLVCCPRIVTHPQAGFVMMSEDFDYCRRVPGGVWYASREGFPEIDYGHMTERDIWPEPEVEKVELTPEPKENHEADS